MSVTALSVNRAQNATNFYKNVVSKLLGFSYNNLEEIYTNSNTVSYATDTSFDSRFIVYFTEDYMYFGLKNIDGIDKEIIKALCKSGVLQKIFSESNLKFIDRVSNLPKPFEYGFKDSNCIFELPLSWLAPRDIVLSLKVEESLKSMIRMIEPMKEKILAEIANETFVARMVAEKLKEEKK